MGPAPVVNKLPEGSLRDSLSDMTDLRKAYREVMQGKKPNRLIRFPDLLC